MIGGRIGPPSFIQFFQWVLGMLFPRCFQGEEISLEERAEKEAIGAQRKETLDAIDAALDFTNNQEKESLDRNHQLANDVLASIRRQRHSCD